MSSCAVIERLLYLHREGELNANEKRAVEDHCRSCPRCSAILSDLTLIDRAMEAERSSLSPQTVNVGHLEHVLDRIHKRRTISPGASRWSEALLAWSRPAFALLAIGTLVLMLFQLSRDAMKQSALEGRLAAGSIQQSTVLLNDRLSLARGMFDHMTSPTTRGFLQHSPSQASMADPRSLLSFLVFTGPPGERGLLEELSEKYPALSRIRLDDGLDSTERRILDTEGRRFVKDIERLIEEGTKQ